LDPSPSPTWASKPASERRWAALGGALLGLVSSACDAGYPIAATACDDYCRAQQRADCEDDAPADCVRDCEALRPSSDCDATLSALGACYESSDASAFSCEDDRTKVAPVCLTERRALAECRLPGSGPCFDECQRQSESCQGNLDDCERGCLHTSPRCQRASEHYNACLLRFPVECREWLAPETRSPEEIPCFDEALEVLGCDG
jgi:hypothetical protein